jgi:hypothetical protein
MLSQDEAHHMERWIVVARNWGESSQGLVGASTDFSTVSRDLADRLDVGSDPLSDGTMREDLARELRQVADVIESQIRIMRDDYLATAASLDVLGSAMS